MPASAAELTNSLKKVAAELGFELCGVCPAVAPAGFNNLERWLDAGYAGEMSYFQDRQPAYRHPESILDGVRSIVMLGLNYRSVVQRPPAGGQGLVSKYAWGESDYHDLIHEKLSQLKRYLLQHAPQARIRGVVDTAPLLEREFAQLAGLGWQGKNTLLLNKQLGSWFFLAALLTDQLLSFDAPHTADHCGTCRACLDACPTDAFVQPNLLDATRCISYLTIELRGPIPHDLRRGMGDWVFGCDVCQDVCPWNHRAPETRQQTLHPQTESNPIDLCELFYLSESEFRARFRRTPLWRSKRRGILRNAAIVLGNQRFEPAAEPLSAGLDDEESLVRGACAWALGQIRSPTALIALQRRQPIEVDQQVQLEIMQALDSR